MEERKESVDSNNIEEITESVDSNSTEEITESLDSNNVKEMRKRTDDVIKIIEKDNVIFDTNGIVNFLLKENMENKHFNDFESVEQSVKVLNTIVFFEHYKNEEKTSFNDLLTQLDDRFAVENSYRWVKRYNDIMKSINKRHRQIEHSVFVKFNKKRANKLKFEEKKYISFWKKLQDEIDLTSDKYICNKSGGYEQKDCYKDYVKIHNSNYSTTPIWEKTVPKEIHQIFVEGSESYREIFEEINQIFRGEKIINDETDEITISKSINVCKMMIFPTSLSEDLTVYRRDEHAEMNESITTSGFYSCSLSFDRVRTYNNLSGTGRILKIKIPSGQKFLIVNSFRKQEKEIVLMPSTLLSMNNSMGIPCRQINESSEIVFCEYVVEQTYQMEENLGNALFNSKFSNLKKELLKLVLKDVMEKIK